MGSTVVSRLRSPVALVLVGLAVLLLLAGIVGHTGDGAPRAAAAASGDDGISTGLPAADPPPYDVAPAPPPIPRKPGLPGGGLQVFGHRNFLVAYYGTAQTGSMGVLGATDPDTMQPVRTSEGPWKDPIDPVAKAAGIRELIDRREAGRRGESRGRPDDPEGWL